LDAVIVNCNVVAGPILGAVVYVEVVTCPRISYQ
jgi:hypothetical protein